MNLAPGQETNIPILTKVGRFIINLRRRYHPTAIGEYQAYVQGHGYSEGFTPEESIKKVLIEWNITKK